MSLKPTLTGMATRLESESTKPRRLEEIEDEKHATWFECGFHLREHLCVREMMKRGDGGDAVEACVRLRRAVPASKRFKISLHHISQFELNIWKLGGARAGDANHLGGEVEGEDTCGSCRQDACAPSVGVLNIQRLRPQLHNVLRVAAKSCRCRNLFPEPHDSLLGDGCSR